MCVHVRVCTLVATVYPWGSEDNLLEFASSFYHMSPGTALVFRLGSVCLYSQNHPAGPTLARQTLPAPSADDLWLRVRGLGRTIVASGAATWCLTPDPTYDAACCSTFFIWNRTGLHCFVSRNLLTDEY